ncbi:hypothetical protein [Roseomonas chloroacetimidivorans]|uniref:hypothetical protein n=1 Tax=Roseomonas chloroacetimidivorans TaxID=1766656 RepID=UPI003C73D6E3
MNHPRLAILLPCLALGAGLAACAPADPYYGAAAPVPAPGYAAPGYAAPGYASSYATPMPGYVGQGQYQPAPGPGYASADSYCQEAYANAAGTQQRAAMTGSYADAARAQRSAGFYRRDC